MPAAASGRNRRLFWIWMFQFVEFFILHPVDFAVLVDMDDHLFAIDKVWYNGRAFSSLDSLVQQYNENNVPKTKMSFPVVSKSLFSTMYRRGTEVPKSSQLPPISIEPNGRRYSVKGQHVKYMNWDFDFRMSSTRGPQLYDICFQNDRIVHEIGLQEISVFYSGKNPTQMFSNFFDSMSLIGPRGKNLVPGVDCPSHATFLPASHVMEISEELVTIQNAFCLFEFNTGMPLRRHHAQMSYHGTFYEGLPNSVFILRSILTVVNYSYLIDYIFYHTGAVEVKVVSTGYILPTPYTANATLASKSATISTVTFITICSALRLTWTFKERRTVTELLISQQQTLPINSIQTQTQKSFRASFLFLKRRQKGRLLTNSTLILLSTICFITIKELTSSEFLSHIDS